MLVPLAFFTFMVLYGFCKCALQQFSSFLFLSCCSKRALDVHELVFNHQNIHVVITLTLLKKGL